MFVLKRKEGEWITIALDDDTSIRIGFSEIKAGHPGKLKVLIDDPGNLFRVSRDEAHGRVTAHGGVTTHGGVTA